MRYIIHADNNADAITGLNAISSLNKNGYKDCLFVFHTAQGKRTAYARQTKTGASVRVIAE